MMSHYRLKAIMKWMTVTCVVTSLINNQPVEAQNSRTVNMKTRSQVLDRLTSSENENMRNPPNYDLPEPAEIYCDLWVNSFDSVNEASMDFTIAIRLHLNWRHHHVKKEFDTVGSVVDFVELNSNKMANFWVPDIYFPNEKQASFHEVMMSNKMMRLYRNGTISYTTRLSLTLSCPMDLRSYPFDKQTCSIRIESFGYTDRQLVLRWSNHTDDAVKLESKELPQFRVKHYNYSDFTGFHQIKGNYSYLQADFHLSRSIGYFMIQMYIPSLLIVMLSWVSFWLNVNSVPARISLGVLSVLTMSTQSSGVNASLPRVSYIKAIDIWMTTCLVFVFAALIEFSIANVISRKGSGKGHLIKRLFQLTRYGRFEKEDIQNGNNTRKGLRKRETNTRKETNGNTKDIVVNMDGTVNVTYEPEENKPKFHKGMLYAMYLDVASRVLFPVIFGVFNIVYWVHFLNIMDY